MLASDNSSLLLFTFLNHVGMCATDFVIGLEIFNPSMSLWKYIFNLPLYLLNITLDDIMILSPLIKFSAECNKLLGKKINLPTSDFTNSLS